MKLAIVTSQFNPEVTGGLRDGARAYLAEKGVAAPSIDEFPAPGAFEISGAGIERVDGRADLRHQRAIADGQPAIPHPAQNAAASAVLETLGRVEREFSLGGGLGPLEPVLLVTAAEAAGRWRHGHISSTATTPRMARPLRITCPICAARNSRAAVNSASSA